MIAEWIARWTDKREDFRNIDKVQTKRLRYFEVSRWFSLYFIMYGTPTHQQLTPYILNKVLGSFLFKAMKQGEQTKLENK